MRACENRVMRRICARKEDEVTGRWRRLHIERFVFWASFKHNEI
jgi:hypothetical protein